MQNLGERLAALEERVDNHRDDILRQMESNQSLILLHLAPLNKLAETVDKHDDQIHFWRGSLAILGLLWLGLSAYVSEFWHRR